METTVSSNLSQPKVVDDRFENPWSSWRWYKIWDLLKFVVWEKDLRKIPHSKTELNTTLPVIPLRADDFEHPPPGIRFTWIGHATVIYQFDGVTILTDPVFSKSIGPSGARFLSRYRPSPCKVEDLPKIDAVVISHNHYDHLDLESVYKLNERFGKDLAWFVPLGMARWMHHSGVKTVTELSWWQGGFITGNESVKFVCTPSQHWSKRGVFDTNKMLWSSWSIIGPTHRVFFGGDTGYCTGFKEIGDQFGPFDLAAIPIGAYHPRVFLEPQHVDPTQAVYIHKDIKAKKSLGIHWGTFPLSREFYLDPPVKFTEAAEANDVDPCNCFTLKHGEVRELTTDSQFVEK